MLHKMTDRIGGITGTPGLEMTVALSIELMSETSWHRSSIAIPEALLIPPFDLPVV
jgi:hypothetical protein